MVGKQAQWESWTWERNRAVLHVIGDLPTGNGGDQSAPRPKPGLFTCRCAWQLHTPSPSEEPGKHAHSPSTWRGGLSETYTAAERTHIEDLPIGGTPTAWKKRARRTCRTGELAEKRYCSSNKRKLKIIIRVIKEIWKNMISTNKNRLLMEKKKEKGKILGN